MTGKWTVYCAHCTVSGKKYVGMTRLVLRERIWGHVSDMKHKDALRRPFIHALVAHGINAFIWGVISTHRTKRAASAAEIHWIKKLGTYGRGYNGSRGGDYSGCTTWIKGSPDTLAHMRRMASARTFKPRDESTKRKISDANKRFYAVVGRSPEWSRKISESLKRRNAADQKTQSSLAR